MKYFYLLQIFLFTTSILTAQSAGWLWAHNFSNTGPVSYQFGLSKFDTQGNVYMTGVFMGTIDFDPGPAVQTLSTNSQLNDIFIFKADSLGNFLWVKQLQGDSSQDAVYDIEISSINGELYITGQFTNTVDFDPGAGVYNLTSSGGYDIFVLKLDSAGNFIWAQSFGSPNSEHVRCITLSEENNGNFFLVGASNDSIDLDPGPGIYYSKVNENFIIKIDINGNFIWARSLHAYITDLIIDPVNYNMILTGYFNDTTDFDPGPGVNNLTGDVLEIFMLCLDSAAQFNWVNHLGIGAEGSGIKLDLDPAGNIYLVGRLESAGDFDPGPGIFNLSTAGNFDMFICTFDNNGNFITAGNMGGLNQDYVWDIAAVSPAEVYIIGSFDVTADMDPGPGNYVLTSNGDDDAFILKTDILLNLKWAFNYGNAGYDFFGNIDKDLNGSLLVTGIGSSGGITIGNINLPTNGIGGNVIYGKINPDLVTGDSELSKTSKILLSPNPANEIINLQFNNIMTGFSKITISDLTGRIFFSEKTTRSSVCNIKTSNWPPGMYLLHSHIDGVLYVSKFIIAH